MPRRNDDAERDLIQTVRRALVGQRGWNVADGLHAIAAAIDRLADAMGEGLDAPVGPLEPPPPARRPDEPPITVQPADGG